MPRGTRTTAPAKADENGQIDYTERATRPATPTMVRFADWLVEKVYDGDFPLKDRDSFNEGVKLAGTLKAEFQGSPENKAAREASKQAHLDYAAGVAERRAAREQARAEREQAKAERPARGRGRPPKTETDGETETPKPRRGRQPKADKPETPARGRTGGTTGRRGAPQPATAARRGRGRPAADAPAPY